MIVVAVVVGVAVDVAVVGMCLVYPKVTRDRKTDLVSVKDCWPKMV